MRNRMDEILARMRSAPRPPKPLEDMTDDEIIAFYMAGGAPEDVAHEAIPFIRGKPGGDVM